MPQCEAPRPPPADSDTTSPVHLAHDRRILRALRRTIAASTVRSLGLSRLVPATELAVAVVAQDWRTCRVDVLAEGER